MAYPTAASRDIAAPAEKVWELVADLPRMGEWSPENAGGKWMNGSTGPALGAVFKGNNRNGIRRWSTKVTESWVDKRKPWFATIARVMGDHSASAAERQMAQTLDNLAKAAE